MTEFDYNQSVWGAGQANLQWSSPTYLRLFYALNMLSGLPTGARVLEVGCGAGQFIRAIKKQRPDLVCVGSDISSTAITAARKFNDGVEYYVVETPATQFGESSFDAVLIFDVLEHVPSPTGFLHDVRQVLKAGGALYMYVPCEGDWLSLWHCLDIVGLKRGVTKKYAGHIQYFSRAEVKRLLVVEHYIIESIRYSEHVLGQLVGIVAFYLMDHFAKNNPKQINNEAYFEKLDKQERLSLVRKLVNWLVALEGRILSRFPSPNVHVVARKI